MKNKLIFIFLTSLLCPLGFLSLQSKVYGEEKIICRATNNLTLATLMGRQGFFGWFNDNYSDSIRAYDEYIKCFAKTNSNRAFALTIRGLAKESIGDIQGACDDWNEVNYLEDEKGNFYDPYPHYWAVFKKEYKKERKSKDHTNAFQSVEKKMKNYDYEAGLNIKYQAMACRAVWEIKK